MANCIMPTLGVLLLLGAGSGFAQLKPEIIERGKKATALVELSNASGWSGTAFCVDKSGLFLTNARVIEKVLTGSGSITLYVDIGEATQRGLRARVLRHDDRMKLALLQVTNRPTPEELKKDATALLRSVTRPKGDLVFTPLELGNGANLRELAEIATIGYPFGKAALLGRLSTIPPVTVVSNHISALRKDDRRLLGIQIDSQLKAGFSGGPVLDASGNVVGMVAATVEGAAMNLAIPADRLAEFLGAPGIVFNPPPLSDDDRTRQVSWTIRIAPPMPGARIPEGLSVGLTLKVGSSKPRTFTADPAGPGVFKLTLNPLPKDPEQGVALLARFSSRGPTVRIYSSDRTITIGGKSFNLSKLRAIYPSGASRAETVDGKTITGKIEGLGTAQAGVGQSAGIYDLQAARQITVHLLNVTLQEILAEIEARQGPNVVAMVRTPIKFVARPAIASGARPETVAPRRIVTPGPLAPRQPGGDEGPVKLDGVLNIDGVPRGAGKSIRPPRIDIPPARLTPDSQQGAEAPLVRQLGGAVSDVVVGGGGRYLLLVLSDARKLAVFDASAGDIINMIPLTTGNALVAAGATKLLIAYPEVKRIERWDLAKMTRDGDSRPLPFEGPLRAIVMGSDSEGPALAFWTTGEPGPGLNVYHARFSFIELESLLVPRISSFKQGKFATVSEFDKLSASKGSFMVNQFLGHGKDEHVSLRASAGGAIFGIWQSPQRFQTLTAHGSELAVTFTTDFLGYLAPEANGQSVCTGLGRRLHVDAPIGNEIPGYTAKTPDPVLPTSDPSYYMAVSGLPRDVAGTATVYDMKALAPRPDAVTLSIHAAGDGTRLLTVYGLDEMSVAARYSDWFQGDLTTDKRYHFVPAAGLLITIPPTKDRLILRRLEIDKALHQVGVDDVFVTSPLLISVTAGDELDHQIVARSKNGVTKYTLTKGPDGLTVSADGKLKWLVPRTLKGQDIEAVVTVEDATGEERFRKLTIRVN